MQDTSASLIEDLERALASGSAAHRADMLARVSELFVGGASTYAQHQIDVFDDIFLNFANRIESQALAQLSNLLAPMANAPLRIVRALAFDDDVTVAGPVLAQSPRLTESDLRDAARTKSQAHLLAIAGRTVLGESITDLLVERGDRNVVHSVARNRGARFSDAGFRNVVRRSKGDDDLASEVGARRDLPAHHLSELIEQASAAVRDKLVATNPQAAAAVRQIVANAADAVRERVRGASEDYAAATARTAALLRAGGLTEDALYAAARERRFEDSVVMLATMARVPLNMAERALTDRRRETLVILAKVAGLSWTATKALLLLQAASRGLSAQDLDQALNSFTKLQPETARSVLSFYHGQRGSGGEAPEATQRLALAGR